MKKITLLLSGILYSAVAISQISSAGLYFEGTAIDGNNYATIPHNNVYDIGTGDFTIEAWVRMQSYDGGGHIFRKATGSTGISLRYISIGYLFLDLGGVSYYSNLVLTPNTCHHVAVVKSGTTARFYKDGNLISTSTVSLININTTQPICIGGGPSLWSMRGFIHEVRFWNIARSQTSIQSTMNAMLSGTEPGLTGYWKLNENTGQNINDSSPALNHGYLGSSLSADSSDPVFQAGCTSCNSINAVITATGPTTFCTPGSVTLLASGGTTYAWYVTIPNSTGWLSSPYTSSRTLFASGTYQCVVGNGCDNAISNPIVVTVNQTPSIAISSSNSGFCSSSPSLLTASTGSGNSLQWYYNNSPISGATSTTYTASQVGAYYCRANSASCGSVNSNVFNYYGNTTPVPVITPSGTLENCSGAYPVTLSVNPPSDMANYNHNWYRNGYNMGFMYETSNVQISAPGNYYASVWYSCGVQPVVTSNSLDLKVLPAPSIPLDYSSYYGTYGCPGMGIYVQVNNFWNSYQWQKDSVDIPGAIGYIYYPTTSGYYRCRVSNFCTSQYSESRFADIVTASITASGPATYCHGNPITLSGPSAPAGSGHTYNYRWYRTGWSGIYSLSQSITTANLPPGTYTYTLNVDASYGCSCCVPTASITVTVLPSPPALITAAGPTAFCAPGSVTLNANTGTGLTYQWQLNNSAIAGATASSYTATITGSYNCVVSDGTCSRSSNSISVVSDLSPIATISATGPTTFCSPGSVTLNANTGTGYTYQWQLNNGPILGATASSYTANTTGSYNCIVTNSCGSATSNNIAVTVNSSPAATISAAGPVTFCAPGSVTLNANTGIGLSYQWRLNGTDIPGETTSSLPVSATGNYDCRVTNSCGNTVSNTIAVSAEVLPTAAAFAAGPTTFCTPGTVTINVTTCTGCSYQWRQNTVNIPGANVSSYAASATGNYDCVVSNTCGPRTSNGVAVSVESSVTATITAGGPITFCSPGSVTLNANTGTGLSYQWRNNSVNIFGATSSSYSASATGNYDCIVTNTCGSTTSNSISVTINSLPSASITAGGSTTFCSPGSVALNANTGAGLSYQWRLNSVDISGAISPSYVANASGNYSCVVANSCGSVTSNTISITVNTVPATPGSITGQTAGVCASTKTYSIGAVAGATGYTWTVPAGATISSGQGTTSVNVAFTSSFGSGAISVLASNTCGSGSPSTITVTGVPALPGNITGPISVCQNQNNVNYSIVAVAGATSYTWTVPAGTQIKSGQGTFKIKVRFGNSAGNITVKANNACGSGPVRTLAIAMPCRNAEDAFEDIFDVTAYPNPAASDFTVLVNSSDNDSYSITIFDLTGRVAEAHKNISANREFKCGEALRDGVYYAEIISGDSRKVLKLVKQK
jgi:hypothetical protein